MYELSLIREGVLVHNADLQCAESDVRKHLSIMQPTMFCYWRTVFEADNIPDSKVHGANMGPIWGRQDPAGPHVGPMNFAIWDTFWRMWWYTKGKPICDNIVLESFQNSSKSINIKHLQISWNISITIVICTTNYNALSTLCSLWKVWKDIYE